MTWILITLSSLLAVSIAAIILLIIIIRKKNTEVVELSSELDVQMLDDSLVRAQLAEVITARDGLLSTLDAIKEESARLELNRQSLESDCTDLRSRLESALDENGRLAEELRAISEDKERLTEEINNIMNALMSFNDVAVKCKTLLLFAKDTTSLEYIRAEIDKAVELLNGVLR